MEGKVILEKIRGKLIVSCQALPSEPMYSAEYPIMKHFAKAAMLGGAGGIRANTVRDIAAIKGEVPLPVIGIIKAEYPDSSVYITPTMAEVESLVEIGCDIIAMDATDRLRPGRGTLNALFEECRQRWPRQLFMADCSNVEEGLNAWKLGFDLIGTTMAGYTPYTKDRTIPDFDMMKALVECGCRVIAEGGIWSPEELKQALDLGAHAAVVGTAITRPMEITRRYAAAVQNR